MPFTAAARGDVIAETLIWVKAKEKATGNPVSIGFWTGAENRTFNVDLEARDYIGGGAALEVPDITTSIGLRIQSHNLTLSKLKGEAAEMVRTLDLRQADVELHSLRIDPETRQIIALDEVQLGFFNRVTITEGRKGGASRIVAAIVSTARWLTVSLPLKNSHEAQQKRGGDQFLKYADATSSSGGAVKEFWGMERTE